MVAIASYNLIAGLLGSLHTHHDSFLANVEMAETSNQTHAIKLASALFKAADQEHIAIIGERLVAID
jgi:hypothetical protein